MRSPRGGDDPPGRATRACLVQHRVSIRTLDKVVERAHHENRVERPVGVGKVAAVALLDVVGPIVTRLLDVERDGIDQGDRILEARQPSRVPTWPAANIEHPRGRGREQTTEQLLGPKSFERPAAEAVALGALLVVGDDLGIHRRTVRASPGPG